MEDCRSCKSCLSSISVVKQKGLWEGSLLSVSLLENRTVRGMYVCGFEFQPRFGARKQ